MTATELKQFYEKLYFHEIDARDKIQSRLQLSLTVLLVVGGALVFLIQNFDYQAGAWTPIRTTFAFFICMGSVALVCAITFFVNAFLASGYYLLPDTSQTATYKEFLDQTYSEYAERERLVSEAMDQYLVGYYIEYAAFNTRVNDRRSGYVYRCNGTTIAAALLFILAFLAFYFGDLDKAKIRQPTEVSISKPIDVRMIKNRK